MEISPERSPNKRRVVKDALIFSLLSTGGRGGECNGDRPLLPSLEETLTSKER